MGTLVCKVELDKTSGITVTVENADGKITQTVTMDGTTLTIKVQGESDTSTITQKADSIAIKCKTFTLDAETITCTSEKATKHESKDTFDIKSTKDMTMKSQAKIDMAATQDMALSGMNVNVSAQQALSGKGPTGVTLQASGGELKGEGLTLSLKGTTGAKLEGLKVDIKADTMLNAEGTMTTLKGQMTNVQGSLVKLG
jgi:phage baseplate assembly protein gpV